MVKQKKNQIKNPNKNRVKKCIKNTETKKQNMEKVDWSCSNTESEDEEQSKHGTVKVPSGLAEKPIKVTLKKTRSYSSSSSRSRESTQSFKVVKSVPSASKSASGVEDEVNENDSNDKSQTKASTFSGENPNESNNDNIEISSDESEKSFSERPSRVKPVKVERKNANAMCSNINIELSSDESEKSFIVTPIPVVPEKNEKKDARTISLKENIVISSDESEKSFAEKPPSPVPVNDETKDVKPLHTVINLKIENVPQNSPTVKNEYKANLLKDELLKEDDNEVVVLNDDDNSGVSTSKTQNGVEVKEPVKEYKFKLNVRSSVELFPPNKSNSINIPPGQPNGQPNFLSQNGAQFPLSPYMLCDVCGIQFDSSELLSEHKVAMKHFKCSFKDCEHIVLSSQQEFLDHQRLIHSSMPSPVQQLAHQVQSLPAMGFDQLLQSGVPPLPDNLPPPPSLGVPNMYSQTMRIPPQPVPMQRPMRPMIRQTMPHMSMRGRNVLRGQRGRPASMNPSMTRGGSIKRPASMPLRGSPALKRTPTDRKYLNNLNQTTQIVKSLSQSLTKPLSPAGYKGPQNATQQDVVNLFSKRGLTISTVESSGNNSISLPPGVSLNSAVTIIPTSPLKVPNNVPSKVANQTYYKVSNVPRKSVDTVDLTGPEKKLWPCEICSKTYTTMDSLYEHVSTLHRSHSFSYKCNLCKSSFPNPEMLRRHKLTNHKQEESVNSQFVVPILDISKSSTIAKLQSMGVTNYIPVAQLDSHGSQYGLPIMNISRPGSVDGLKYTNFFNLGSVRKL